MHQVRSKALIPPKQHLQQNFPFLSLGPLRVSLTFAMFQFDWCQRVLRFFRYFFVFEIRCSTKSAKSWETQWLNLVIGYVFVSSGYDVLVVKVWVVKAGPSLKFRSQLRWCLKPPSLPCHQLCDAQTSGRAGEDGKGSKSTS